MPDEVFRGASRADLGLRVCPWEHHRAVRPMVRGVSALSKHIYWPWKANRRVYHSRAGFWSSIFACLIARGVHGLFWSWGNPERSNARYNYSPEGTASRSRHFTSLGGQLECKDDQGTRNLRPQVKIRARAFDFCLSTSIPVLTTSTYVVAWPQGDQLLGGSPWHKAILPTTQ